MWILIHLKHTGEVQLLQQVTEKIKESRTKASERQAASLLSKVCVLTLRQRVDSHPKLPEIGMLHCLISWNSLLGFVLRRQKQETLSILWLYQKMHQCSVVSAIREFTQIYIRKGTRRSSLLCLLLSAWTSVCFCVFCNGKVEALPLQKHTDVNMSAFFHIQQMGTEITGNKQRQSDMNWWYCGSRLVP